MAFLFLIEEVNYKLISKTENSNGYAAKDKSQLRKDLVEASAKQC